ncbi:MAG: sugar-binding protein, partial [Victivallaceae bacterium]|nr:sugar-binding protein [Victivallaceae bacterium]
EAVERIDGDLISGSIDGIVVPGRACNATLMLHNPGKEPITFEFIFMAAPGISDNPVAPVKVNPGRTKRLSLAVKTAVDFALPTGGFDGADNFRVLYDIKESGWRGEISLPLYSIATIAPTGGFSAKPQFVLDRQSQQTSLVGYNPAEDHMRWQGPEDLSAKVYMARRDSVLCFKIVVTDDIHVQQTGGNEMWNGDSIELTLEEPGRKGGWVFGASLLNGKSDFWCWYTANDVSPSEAAKSMKGHITRKGNDTIYYFTIPLKTFGWRTARLASGIRVQLQINDNDGGGREGWMRLDSGSKASTDKPCVVFLP